MKKIKKNKIVAILNIKTIKNFLQNDLNDSCLEGQKAKSLVITEKNKYLSPHTLSFYEKNINLNKVI